MSTRMRLCEGRVVVVTGAGRGLGRSHVLELAHEGARVVVNDLGVAADGRGGSPEPARLVTEAILATGGEAVANCDDVGDWEGSRSLIRAAIGAFGRVDAIVNNAGVVRDQMLVNLAEEDWDAVIRVHMKGHVALAAHAASYWRERAKQDGPADWRIVNTTSPVGLAGASGQSAYVAAKAAIAALTLVEAEELSRYGATANAIAPAARTRLTEAARAEAVAEPQSSKDFDAMDPGNVSPLVAWLCSTDSRGVTGRVFEVQGGRVSLMAGWDRAATFDRGQRLLAEQLRPVVEGLIAQAPGGDSPARPPDGVKPD
ncbi:MAG: SDR family oxidoreductase [Acidimicrobiales bacterium]